MSNAASATPVWPNRGPLYELLYRKFPDHRTSQGLLDVPRLAAGLNLKGRKKKGMSPAGVYKWLDQGRVSQKGVLALVELCNSPDNLAHLEAVGEKPVTREDFVPFLFG